MLITTTPILFSSVEFSLPRDISIGHSSWETPSPSQTTFYVFMCQKSSYLGVA